MPPIVRVTDLRFRYGAHKMALTDLPWTLHNLNLEIEESSALGIVGETGSGKSTLIRILSGLITQYEGEVAFDGRDLRDWHRNSRRIFHARNQIVFQSPRRSLDPRMRIRTALAQPVRALERRKPTEEELHGWLMLVGLSSETLDRYPHQLSGGQLQRVAVARALSVNPRMLYADEPTSALDVSVQAQVLNLLIDLRERLGLTLVFVTHDLAVVSRICEQVIVMKAGRIVESGRTVDVFSHPKDPYTSKLVKAARSVRLVGGPSDN